MLFGRKHMTDYEEEQRHELEALEAIYATEFKFIEEPKCFEITVSSEHHEDNDIKFSVTLQFTYVDAYPDEVPIIEIKPLEGLTDRHVNSLQTFLNEKVEENLGMVMVFTLVSETQEYLNQAVEDEKKSREQERLQRIKELEKAELVRDERIMLALENHPITHMKYELNAKITGTPVTYENFMVWKLKFDTEREVYSKMEAKNKLTGRQLFEQNKLMGTLDEAFMGDDVEVDESLFQDMEDLDLEEELED